KFFLFGTSILNNRMLPTMASLLMYLKGLKPKNRYALTFGSYGWATVGFKEFETSIQEAGFDLIGEGRYVKFVPDVSDLDSLNDVVSSIKDKIAVK
ncbi:MAG: FprA family A-type flavoprotein, partial [Candidatus Omnitrophica bacterium]|nr:FprA family A-type flavoprotein [Candidatus Omnitrophota bacterium]